MLSEPVLAWTRPEPSVPQNRLPIVPSTQPMGRPSSQVGNVADSQRSRWDYRRRIELTLRLLEEPALDCLITGEDAFADLPAVQARLAEAQSGTLMHRIRYD